MSVLRLYDCTEHGMTLNNACCGLAVVSGHVETATPEVADELVNR